MNSVSISFVSTINFCKIIWSQRDRNKEDIIYQQSETAEDKKERERVEKVADKIAIKNLLVLDEDDMEVDYRKKRATSCKHNTNVFLPGPLTAAEEQEVEAR